MRAFILSFTILLSSFFRFTVAYGPRGAAERYVCRDGKEKAFVLTQLTSSRVLYYYAYLAEEMMGQPAGGWTIAADCGSTMHGSRPGKRCNFNQFLEFLWAPKEDVGDTTKPSNINVLRDGEIFEQIPVNTMWQRVLGWTDAVTGHGITGNTDSKKLVYQATDFYDALGKVGKPIGEAEQFLDNGGAGSRNVVQRGKDSATLVFDLRYADMETYRRQTVGNTMRGYGIDLSFENGRTTQPNEAAWQKIDAAATIRNNVAAHPDVAQKLYSAIKSYEEGTDRARNHWAAVTSAQRARVGCACVGAV
jgi:hypothetical protein